MNKNLELAQFVLEKGTYFLGTDISKIDTANFFIDNIKQELGIFEEEIKEFVDLLEKLKIISSVSYVPADTINSELTGFSYECEMNIPKMKEFIEHGAGGATIFDPVKSCIYFGFNELKIPRDTDQYYFCKTMYENESNKWVSWDMIYDEMQDPNDDPDKELKNKRWKNVYDTMSEINKKASKILNINKLFKYEKREFLRTI